MPEFPLSDPDQPDYKTLLSRGFDKDLGVYLTFRDTEVDHGTVLPTWDEGITELAIVNERNVHKSRRKSATVVFDGEGGIVQVPMTTFTCGAGQQLAKFACCTTTTVTFALPSDADPELGFLELSIEKKRLTPGSSSLTRVSVDAWKSTIVADELDEEGLRHFVIEEVIPADDPLPADEPDIVYSRRNADCQHDIRTSEAINNWMDHAREYYTTINYSFPNVYLGETTTATFIKQFRKTEFSYYPNIRQGYSGPVRARVVETFTDDGTPSTGLEMIFQPNPEPLFYDGTLFRVATPEVLHDDISLTATCNSADTYFGGSAFETYERDATEISATEFMALVSGETEVCIEDSFTPYGKFGLFKRRRVFVVPL